MTKITALEFKKKIVLSFNTFVSFFKVGVKHVVKFSVFNYLLFLVLILISLSFKEWKKTGWLIGLLTTGYFIGILLVFYTDLDVKPDVLKFIIPLLIFSLAIINILMSRNTFKGTISFFSVVLFGFFNGLGSSNDLEQLKTVARKYLIKSTKTTRNYLC